MKDKVHDSLYKRSVEGLSLLTTNFSIYNKQVQTFLSKRGWPFMNQSVIKALQILDLFTEEDELSLHEISIKANMPKSTAYRLLTTMASRDILYKTKETSHDSRYRLGIKLLQYGQLVSDRLELRAIALPYMEKLAEEINEVIHLVIMNQNKATYIEKVDSARGLRLNTSIGKSFPLHIGSGPKMLLASLPKEKQAAFLAEDLVHWHNNEPVNKDLLRKELAEINKNGYAYSIGEQNADTTGISYPIYNHQGMVVASLAVSGLSTYYKGENLLKIKAKSEQTARYISGELGYS